MRNKWKLLILVGLLLSLVVASCAPAATAPEAEEAPAEEVAEEAEAEETGSLDGKKVCYLIPETGNAFLSGLTEGVKAKFAADGVEVLIYGAEGSATTQFNQIENCISIGVDGMVVMAALEPEGVEASILEAKEAGIMVMGVPVDQMGPYDAIMHTDQFEIGTTMAEMACDWIDARYPDAAEDSIEVAVIGTKGSEQIKKRSEGMETIDSCPKAKLVQFVDVPETTISEAVSATENILTANPNVKVVLVVGDSGAQGVAEAMAAYAPDTLDEYAVFSGDISPDNQQLVPNCEAGAYRGAVAIGGSLDDLINSTYEIMKGMISGGDFPAETIDPLTTFRCEVAGAETAEEKPPAPEFIELGSSISLTGNFGSLGSMILPGYEIAVEHINAQGGVYVEEYGVQIPLRLTYYDDESDPTKAVSKMETLFSDLDLTAYLGGGGSPMHAASAAIAEKNQVPYMGIAFALYQIHQQGYKYLFSPFPKSPQQANDTFAILNAALPEGERPTKVAIFTYSDDWGKEIGDLWEEKAAEYGYEVVVRAENAVGVNDWSDAVLRAKAADAEVLLTLPIFPDGSGMYKTMSELGWSPKFAMVIRAPEGVNWGETMGKIGDYVTIFPGWHYGAQYSGVDELNAAYEAEYGRPADILTGPAYACVQIIAAAIEEAGTLDSEAVRDAIANIEMETVMGPVSFNEDGTGNVWNPLIQWQDGALELVWPADHATADFVYPAPAFDER